MHSVGESLLQSRNSVGRELNRKKMRGSNEAECMQSEKACYETTIPSEAKPTIHQKEQADERVESRKRNRRCVRKRDNKYKREIDRKREREREQ
jgi:hypothetical protein